LRIGVAVLERTEREGTLVPASVSSGTVRVVILTGTRRSE
jgi:hypothetical protein